MIGIGLMRKHLVQYNRGIKDVYLIKGVSKMKADEVKKVFNERLKSVKMGDTVQGKGKAPFDYYVPDTSSFDIPYDDQKFRDLMKPKEKVKKNEAKPSNAPKPIVKKNIIIKKKVVVKPVVKPAVKPVVKKPEDKSTSVAREQPIRRVREAPIRRKKKKVIEEK